VRACVRVYVCVRVCVRARVFACACAFVCACVCVIACVWVFVALLELPVCPRVELPVGCRCHAVDLRHARRRPLPQSDDGTVLSSPNCAERLRVTTVDSLQVTARRADERCGGWKQR